MTRIYPYKDTLIYHSYINKLVYYYTNIFIHYYHSYIDKFIHIFNV